MKTVCVLGLGYIGLPTAAIMAANGFKVAGIDINEAIVETIQKGAIHIKEPGLNTIVTAAVNSGNLTVHTKPVKADVFIIATPTPIYQDKKADLSFVISATRSIVPVLEKGNLVILESTCPPRTTIDVIAPILASSGLKAGEDLFLAHCPERVLPGNILYELVYNSRIIGGINEKSALTAQKVYEKFVQGKIVITDATSAEMSKLMENTFRDVNIALANELCKIAYDLNLDALEIIKLANMHPRVNLHQPGPGVGGHCLAVDPWFIVEKSNFARLIGLSREINDSMPEFVINRAMALLSNIKDPVITVLGMTYKGNIDDIRESPAIKIINGLCERGCTVKIHDPYVKNSAFKIYGLSESLSGSDLLLVLADHKDFKELSPEFSGELVRNRILLDTKNYLSHGDWKKNGFAVEALGKYNEL